MTLYFRNGTRRFRRHLYQAMLFACVLAAALRPSHVRAYRTIRDTPGFESYSRVAWTQPRVDFSVPFGMSHATDVFSVVGSFDTDLGALDCAAVNVAAHTATAPLTVADHLGDGQSSIFLLTNDWAALGLPPNRMAVTETAYAMLPNGTPFIVEADILINAKDFSYSFESQPSADPNARSFRSVLTHELAHALGMAHPCESDGANAPVCSSDPTYATLLMYPDYTGDEQYRLESDDIAGLCFLYPASSCANACSNGTICTPDGCAALCGHGVCAIGAACVDGACRAPCGDSHCAVGDGCVDGACRAMCQGEVICAPGMVCGENGCTASCIGAPCVDRACDESNPCPEGLACIDALCSTEPGVLGGACQRDRDCGDEAAICFFGACVSAVAREGDPCSSDAACASGTCRGETCRRPCSVGCLPGSACSDEGATEFCAWPENVRGLGASCAGGAGCVSNACLAVDTSPKSCTRTCSLEADDCPRGYVCSDIDGFGGACVDDSLLDAPNCAASSVPSPAPRPWVALLLFVCLLSYRSMHRKRNA